MGKRARGKGIATAALRAAAAEARDQKQCQDEEAQAIAREVFAAVVAMRPHAGKAPMWAIGPLSYVSDMAAEMVGGIRDDLNRADVEEVSAYILAGLSDLLIAMTVDFDAEHFVRWRQEREAGESALRNLKGVGDDGDDTG